MCLARWGRRFFPPQKNKGTVPETIVSEGLERGQLHQIGHSNGRRSRPSGRCSHDHAGRSARFAVEFAIRSKTMSSVLYKWPLAPVPDEHRHHSECINTGHVRG